MSASVLETRTATGGDNRHGTQLRSALIAGPGGGVTVADDLLDGVLHAVADAEAIEAGLRLVGHVDARRRVLTGAVTVVAVLGLCLFRGENYDLVLARILARLPRVAVEGVPSGAALSQARARLAPDGMRVIFEQTAAVMATPGPECLAFGLLVTAFDGTVFDLGAPRGASLYPQHSWEELEGRFLGLMAHLNAKARGNHSLPEKQRSCSGV